MHAFAGFVKDIIIALELLELSLSSEVVNVEVESKNIYILLTLLVT